MKSAYEMSEKRRVRTAEKSHKIPTGMNPAQQIAYINARLDEAQAEFDSQRNGYWDALMLTMLWVIHEEYGFGQERLVRLYKALVRDRARMRVQCRECDPDEWGRDSYRLLETGKNAEDVGYKEQLRQIGFDYDEWERRCFFVDEKTGEVDWRE